MSLLGKVLTVLNALAAIGFLVLVGMDYSARNSWAYSVFRHELAIHGLPLDDKDDSWRPGVPIVKDLNATTLQALFGPGAEGPKTQLSAVEGAKAAALGWIDEQPTDAKKREMIAAVWLPTLRHLHEREAALNFIRTKPIDELRGNIGAIFDETLQSIQSNKDGAEATRRRVADLLYNVNPTADPALRDWAAAVVGLEEYVAAADRSANNLYAIARNLEQVVREENAILVRQYNDLLPRLTLLNERLKADKTRLETQQKLLETHTLVYQARRAERDELQQQLDAARQKAAAETVNLAAVQQQLFELQRDLASAREANEKLEAQIRGKELGR